MVHHYIQCIIEPSGIPQLVPGVVTSLGLNDALQVGTTSRSWQKWDRVIVEATQLVRFALSVDLGSIHIVCRAVYGTSSITAVIVRLEAVNQRTRIVEL
jgi:hypothetical protein